MKQLLAGLACLTISFAAAAQKSPEFPKGGVIYLAAHDGITTNFTKSPDLFISGLRLSPQLTLIPGHLRLGGTAGLIFNNKKIDGVFGPSLAVKLADFNVSNFGTILNLHLQGEYLWGSRNQRLIGGLVNIEIGQFLLIGFHTHRDYGLNYWWFQGGFGYNLLHKRKTAEDPIK